jgi:hypothetical protein
MKKLLIIASLGFALNGHSQLNVNLQGCYPMDCDSAQNYAPTGSTLNGIISNVTCANGHTGVSNTSYQFAGNTTSYIKLPASTLLKPTAITVAGWYYVDPTTVTNGAYVVFTKNSCTSNQEAYAMCVSGGKFIVAKASLAQSCSRDIVYGPNVVANAWHFVLFYIDNSTIELYVDSCANPYNMSTSITWDYVSTKPVILGGSQETVDAPFKGRMDNIRFYNRRLTAAEICTLYQKDPRCQYDGTKPAPTALHTLLGEKNAGGMDQNMPNPFNDKTTITYNTPASFSTAQIVITSIEGKLIKAVNINTHGEGQLEMDTYDLGKGMYMYSLVIDGKTVETRKMIKE